MTRQLKPRPGDVLVCTYDYTDQHGQVLFSKLRYKPKRFTIEMPRERCRSERGGNWCPWEIKRMQDGRAGNIYGRPTHPHRPMTDVGWCLYRLPDVIAAEGDVVHWPEGEKDVEAVERAGGVATTHWQGAGKATREQAHWLLGAAQVIIWADVDLEHPEVGAYCAAMRYRRLLAAGYPIRRIKIVRAAVGKDAYDHLQEYELDEAVPVDLDRLARHASQYQPATARRLGYYR
jgi:hypothetical protein